ncbi:cytochrome P450 [Streptomyces avidinii]
MTSGIDDASTAIGAAEIGSRKRPPSLRLPAVVQTLLFAQYRHKLFPLLRRRHGDIFTLRLTAPTRHLVILTKQEDIKTVFGGPVDVLHAGEGNAIMGPALGDHSVLLTDEGEHRRSRRLLMPAFTGAALAGYQQMVGELTGAEVESWPEETVFSSHERMQALTLEVILQVVFGVTDEARLTRMRPLVRGYAWHGLMKTVRHEEEATTELARKDFGERLAGLGIERDPDGRLRFDRLAYADAVRTYFWANFPGVRDDLRDWIGRAAGLRGLTTDDRVNVVVRFGERALAVERPYHLFDLGALGGPHGTGMPCDPRAVAALELGLGHERSGGGFASGCTSASRDPAPCSDGLARVLTTACVQSLSTTHPDQAVGTILLSRRTAGGSGARGP